MTLNQKSEGGDGSQLPPFLPNIPTFPNLCICPSVRLTGCNISYRVSPLELFVQPYEDNSQDCCCAYGEECGAGIDSHSYDVAGTSGFYQKSELVFGLELRRIVEQEERTWIHITGIDGGRVRNSINHCKSGCTFCWWSRKRVTDPR